MVANGTPWIMVASVVRSRYMGSGDSGSKASKLRSTGMINKPLSSSKVCDGQHTMGAVVTGITESKQALRSLAKQLRAAAFVAHGIRAGQAIAGHGLRFLMPSPGAAVSGFSAINDEIDPLTLMTQLAGEGHPLALPAMQGKGQPLLFRAWSPGDEMAPAVWGIAEPLAARPAIQPDIVLVPLLAFDAVGHRLGYGGGFYDRSLAQLRAHKTVIAVGIAYDEQRVDAVPHLDYDQPLDWVLTPSGPLKCRGPDPHAPAFSR